MTSPFPPATFLPITHLQLDVPHQYEPFGLGFESLLSSFSSVEELEYTEQTTGQINRISGTEHFFPQLKILKIDVTKSY